MQQFARLLPYLWQHRWKLYASMGFALVVAALWAATLSLTYLVVTVLLKDQSLQQFVDLEVQNCEVEIDKRERELDELERQLEALAFAATQEGKPIPSDKEILRRQERATRKLSAERQKLVACRWIQRHVMPWIPTDQFRTYAWILGILVIGTMLKGTAVFIQEVLVGSVVELTVMALRKDCFRHALDLDYQSLMRHGKPELMSRFTNDISVASDGLNLIGGRIVREPLKAIACIVVALLVNWQLTMMSMVFVPVMFVIFNRYGKLLKRASHQMMERMSRIYKSLEETLDSLKVVFAFNGERRHRQRFHRENKDYYHQAMKVVQIDSLTSPTTELLLTLAVCVSLLPGAYLVLRHEDTIWGIKLASAPMSIEDLSWLYALLAGTLDPVRKLSSIYSKIKRSAAATERIFQVLDWQPALKQLEQPQHLPRHSQSISFKKVSFRYDSDGIDRPNALTDVTLKITAGEVVVVVGENGSGKSTLVNLLPRFYDPNSGSVLIDGIDLRNVRLRDLRSQIGVVTQETQLFDDSIYENIRYGNPDATHAEVLAAAEKAHIPQFLDQLPEGFATRVGPRGNRLSGGQRQRVALARALLINPSILVLDEATSAVDAQSESLIHQCLGDFVKGRTVFLITHSVTPDILQFATRIVILEQGQLLAAGAHEEVLRSCPAYQRLFRAQTSAQGSDSQIELQADLPTTTDTDSEPKAAVESPLVLKFPPCNQTASNEARRKAN